MLQQDLWSSVVRTPLGSMSIVASDKGLVALDFGPRAPRELHGARVQRDDRHRVLRATASQLLEYFDGSRRKFDIPLDLVGTPFQLQAWRAMSRIPFGRTISYAQEAERIGRPRAVRAVGSANGRNPVPIVVPCHRVVSSDGSLGGYSAGLDKKVWLLAHEGVRLPGSDHSDRQRRR